MSCRLASVFVSCFVLSVVLLVAFGGCGSGQFPVAQAKGKVVCNGRPVTSGSVTFSPMGDGKSLEVGKSATATIGPDGMFVLTTHNRFDGAVVGMHRVQYVGSEGEESDDESTAAEGSPEEQAENAKRAQRQAAAKSQCVQAGEISVEVKADGNNDFTIELTAGGNAAGD